MRSFVLFCLYLKTICNVFVYSIDPLVLTTNGLVQGLLAEDGYYSMFLGIPYAQVDPSNPFGIANNASKFDNIYEANDDSIMCPQLEDFNNTITGSLDCLRVNLYIPHSATSHNRLPVMIWIHGGAFRKWTSGRYSYGPKFLVKKDIILVTLNYRLGPYGFMCVNTPEIPGNTGLRDQLTALRWIKENIAAFGGDVDNITLFGESAGAAAVEFHMLSKLNEGLFHRVIMQSGTILSDWVMAESDPNAPNKLAAHLGYTSENSSDALEFLEKADVYDVISAAIQLDYPFRPCVEQLFTNVPRMITSKPSALLMSGPHRPVPILSGFNNIERLDTMFYLTQTPNYIETAGKTFKAKSQNYFNFDSSDLDHAEKLVHQFYIGDRSLGDDVLKEMIEFDSDFTFVHPLQRSTSFHLSRNDNPVYQYMFSYSGDRNYNKYRYNITEPGASHADEIGYLFDQNYIVVDVEPRDQFTIDRLTTMWTNFAKYGNPTPELNNVISARWDPSQQDIRRFMVIDDELHMEHHAYHQRMAFWDVFFELYKGKEKW